MKILYLPLNVGPHAIQIAMYEAFDELGEEWEPFDYYQMYTHYNNSQFVNQCLLQKVREYKPDLIHMQLQMTGIIKVDTLLKIKEEFPNVKITNWTGDIRQEANSHMVNIAPGVDYSFLCGSGQIELYKQAGCHNAAHWQFGYSPKREYPLNYTQFDYDISFLANCYGPESNFPDSQLRYQVGILCKQHFGVRCGLFGAGWGDGVQQVPGTQANDIYNRSLCGLNISNFNNVAHYFSDRLLSCLASGRPTISWYFPGLEDYFVEGKEILVARTPQEIISHVEWCKNNLAAANEIGIAGHAKVLAEHTWVHRLKELLTMTGLSKH